MKLIATLALGISVAAIGQSYLAPRASTLAGTANLPSRSGYYVLTFPPPNECVTIQHVKADSRAKALYAAVSAGGFTLLPSKFGMTVWTQEEWDGFIKEDPVFRSWYDKHCSTE